MATQVIAQFIDDLDGAPAAETVSFALDGVEYEIDLSAGHAQQLRQAFEQWVGHSRRIDDRGRRRVVVPSQMSVVQVAPDTRTLRAWAQANGIMVPAKGRIPATVFELFAAANP